MHPQTNSINVLRTRNVKSDVGTHAAKQTRKWKGNQANVSRCVDLRGRADWILCRLDSVTSTDSDDGETNLLEPLSVEHQSSAE